MTGMMDFKNAKKSSNIFKNPQKIFENPKNFQKSYDGGAVFGKSPNVAGLPTGSKLSQQAQTDTTAQSLQSVQAAQSHYGRILNRVF